MKNERNASKTYIYTRVFSRQKPRDLVKWAFVCHFTVRVYLVIFSCIKKIILTHQFFPLAAG